MTYQVTWSNSKLLRRITHEAAFRTVFRAEKRHDDVSPEALRQYSEKAKISCQLPFFKILKYDQAMEDVPYAINSKLVTDAPLSISEHTNK